ncbi:MAG: hypothetical protein ACTSWA_08250 [Candidatus Thorarchaeota archaeon]
MITEKGIEKKEQMHGNSAVVDPLNWDFYGDLSYETLASNEKLLMILHKGSGLAPYTHEFIEGGQDPQVLSGFISAMASFMGEVTGENQSEWKTAYGSDSILLVEGGEWSVGVLVAARETGEARSKLRSVVREFEDSFQAFKDSDGIDRKEFRDFDNYVRRMFVDERVSERTLIWKRLDWRKRISRIQLPSKAFNVSKILLSFDRQQTVKGVAEYLDQSIAEITELVSMAYWHGLVELEYIPSDYDILALSEKASTILFSKSNPLHTSPSCLRLVARLNGRDPLSSFTNDMIISDQDLILSELGSLINNGFIQRISVEKRLVLLNESTLSTLFLKGASIVGHQALRNDFEAIRRKGVLKHPWCGRINITDSMNVNCVLEESMTPIDLDDMYDALDYFVKEITKRLSKRCGKKVAEKMLLKSRESCHQAWAPYLSNVVI